MLRRKVFYSNFLGLRIFLEASQTGHLICAKRRILEMICVTRILFLIMIKKTQNVQG